MSGIEEKASSDLKIQSAETSELIYEVESDAQMRRRVLRKLDMRLLPVATVLYLLAYLDRTNVGNAKIAGLTTDLGLTGVQFNLISALFYIPYCTLEVPANMGLKYFRPSKWIPFIMTCWGIVSICTAFVKNFAGLFIIRLFLGAFESGLWPGLSFWLALWYPRDAQAQRLAIYVAASNLSGAFGGLLAYAIEKMNGIGGLDGWSWIFLLEGIVTVIIALSSAFVMPDFPDTVTFLSPNEKTWLTETLKKDTVSSSKELKHKFLLQALRDPHAYLFASLNFFIVVPLASFAVFLPTIIVGLGYSSVDAQLLSVPPNIIGSLCTVIAGIVSDKAGVRGPFILASALLSLTGYVILLATETPIVGYVGTLIASCGLTPASLCTLAWTAGNAGGDVKRGIMIAIMGTIGNSGSIVASFIYRSEDSPRYRPGHATNIACTCVAATLSIVGMLEYARLNKKKRDQCEKEGIGLDRADEFGELGDGSPLYRYTL
ncbi:MFS general substrate transporter [Daedalea quercina L-15889]|uniref:MFS general substrate transporter n=1 Tax=Daedalea quercina L-15889 TaxID=1314783 RepID=A0A165MSU8_9APHY|nr:MFS general substrate transporter [Daedalea quercina L-15889]